MKFDLHLHTKYSFDCTSRPEKIMKIAKKRGMDGIAVTDHENIRGWSHMIKVAKNFDLMLVLGEELRIRDNNGSYEILGLFLNDRIKTRDIDEIVDQIKEQGGIACLPHPFDPFKARFNNRDYLAKKIDAVEVFNARCPLPIFNEKALTFAKRHKLGMTAGSDAHTEQEVGRAYVEADVNDLDDLKQAILRGEIKVIGKIINPLFRVWSRLNQGVSVFRELG